MKTVKTNQF